MVVGTKSQGTAGKAGSGPGKWVGTVAMSLGGRSVI